MARTIIQLIKACAANLRDSNFQRLGGKEVSSDLDALCKRLELKGREEAIVFIAIFDKSCSGRACDLDDIAIYYDCTVLDVMEYIPALKRLLECGLVSLYNTNECNITSQEFQVPPIAMNSLLDNHLPSIDAVTIGRPEFDRYDFCRLIDGAVQDRDVSFIGLIQRTSDLENSNPEMAFVKNTRNELQEISERALFYEICFDYFNGHNSNIDSTFEDMYESFGMRFSKKRDLLDGKTALTQSSLIEFNDDGSEMTRTDKGQKILLENDYKSFGDRFDCRNRYSFARRVREFFHDRNKFDSDEEGSITKLVRALQKLEDSNRHLSCISKTVGIIPSAEDRVLFYLACNSCPEGINLSRELRILFPINKSMLKLNEFKQEKHELQRMDLVEIRSESSLFGEYVSLGLTDKGKQLYFEEDAEIFRENIDSKDLIRCSDIVAKQLYFSESEQRQLSMVGDSLNQDNYITLTERLSAKGFSKGIAVLLYGAPGTGKTESVMQWAKSTGRDIIHVDLSASKSMWYGESEKIVKNIFTRYRNQCKRSSIKPILLFNEADGLFSKRKDISRGSSVDQTENTIQNILLEEMEKLDGILIATTNLATNLDSAFERRFLFKIELGKPSVEAKRKIWMDKLPSLTEDDADMLSGTFDFSGGEIDNIVRKATMQEILEGTVPDIATLMQLCREEKFSRNSKETTRKIGF